MLLKNLAKNWSSGLWRFLKPKPLLQGVVDCCRVAWSRLADIRTKADNIPAAYGNCYDIISVPLSCVDKNRNIIGIGSVFSEEFPYILTGAPQGVISFSSSVNSVGASLYSDFIEYQGIYYFREPPTKFGVVSTKSGEICTFIVTRLNKDLKRFDDLYRVYHSCGDLEANKVYKGQKQVCEAVNGQSTAKFLIAAGTSVACRSGKIAHYWSEGGRLLAVADNGQLLRDPLADPEGARISVINSGDALTSAVYTQCLIYPGQAGELKACVPTGTGVRKIHMLSHPELGKFLQLPENLEELEVNYVFELLKARGIVSICTDRGSENSQLLVKETTLMPDALWSLQLVEYPGYNADADYCYAYFTGSANAQPINYPDITPREAIHNNLADFAVVRAPLIQNTDSSKTAVLAPGQCWGRSPVLGEYLVAVTLVKASKDEYSKDIILDHKLVAPTKLHAGECVVLYATQP